MAIKSQFKRDVLALTILILGVSLFHIRGLRPGQTFLPVDLANNNLPWRAGPPQPQHTLQNWLISDPLYEYYPFLVNAVNTVRDGGRWPLWNPRIFLGHPVVADPLNQPFYPFFIPLGVLLGTARGLAIGLWLHVVLAAMLMYGFLRTIGCRRAGAVLGAFTYALSGYLVTWFEFTNWTATLSWLPGVLWAFELAVHRRSFRSTAPAGLLMALATLGGQFQYIITFGLFLSLYAAGHTIELARREDRAYAWPLLVLAVTAGLGSSLSAIHTIPFAEFLNLSHRAPSQGALHPLPPQQLITLIVPDFYGNPASVGPYWGELNFIEGTIYAGLPALLLACLAPLCVHRFRVLYMSLITAATLYFVVGGPGVQLMRSIPVVKYASLHRSAFLLPLLIALLAAMALNESRVPIRPAVILGMILAAAVGLAVYLDWDQVQDHWQQLQKPILQAGVLLFATIILLALRGRFLSLRSQADWGMVGLVFVDLFLAGSQFNPAGSIRELMPSTPAIEYLRAHAGLHRVVAYQLNDQVLVGPNVLSIYGIAQPGGYSSLVPARFQQLVRAGDPKADIVEGIGRWLKLNPNIVFFNRPPRRLLDLLQVAYVVSPLPLADPGVRAELVVEGCADDTGEIADWHSVSGSFAVRDTAINRLDMRFRVYEPGQTADPLVIRMWQGATRERLMLEVQQDSAELKDRQNLTLYFAPERDAPGQTYVWEIATPDAAPHTGVGLCTDAHGRPAISVYGVDWSQAYEGEVYIHERLAPLPRTYIVYAAEHIPDDARAVSRLLDESFDLRNVAVTADQLDLPTQAPMPANPAEIVAYKDTRVVINASAAQEGLLILGDQFYPGWQAYLDGQPATVYRVNHITRGVRLPPGDHQVVFEFAPASLRIGSGLSLAGLVLLVLLSVLARHPRIAEWVQDGQSGHEHVAGPGV